MYELQEMIEEAFPQRVQARGQALFDAGAVELRAVDSGPPWFADVAGGERYDVEVDFEQELLGSCDCRAFAEFGPCKHMWATILAIKAAGAIGARPRPGAQVATAESAPPDSWQQRHVSRLRRLQRSAEPPVRILEDRAAQVHYVLLLSTTVERGVAHVAAVLRNRLRTGRWSIAKPFEARSAGLAKVDRDLLQRLAAQRAERSWRNPQFEEFELRDDADAILTDLAATGRLFAAQARHAGGLREEDVGRLQLDPAEELVVDAVLVESGESLALRADFGGAHPAAVERSVGVGDRLFLSGDRLMRWRPAPGRAPELIGELLRDGPLELPASYRDEVARLLSPPADPKPSPTPLLPIAQLHLDRAVDTEDRGTLAEGQLRFRYGGTRVDATDRSATVKDTALRRDVAAERRLVDVFEASGGLVFEGQHGPVAALPAARLLPCVTDLLGAGFEVFAAEQRVRSAGAPQLQVSSGVDWFEVSGTVAFGDEHLALPELLAAVRANRDFVPVRGNTVGVLSRADLSTLLRLLDVGRREGDALRFDRSQAWLLDALLAAREEVDVSCDRAFERLRTRMSEGLVAQPKTEPRGFGATLRPYQRVALGWFDFLRKLGLGGCLADDMGLGKTVQVLALLDQRRRRPSPRPSLVLAPRSLLFHWSREAAKFAPRLRVMTFAGGKRFTEHADAVARDFADHHLVLSTYGTWRIDASRLNEVEWDYVVLDEAQAVKNERSQVSKAVRLCRARHRLALSGTPVENHLGELWSLFEFLNPGMLGRSRTFRELVAKGPAAGGESFARTLGRSLRPFLLRRTKAQVLPELPPKVEQVVRCSLGPEQREQYDAIAAHFRSMLLSGVDGADLPDAMGFEILEALLRLRQVACHPGLLDPALVDPDGAGITCAKFDVLWPMLEELRAEGHKALVFSQFPSFLRLLQKRLRAAGIEHAWLDGQTRDRRRQVDRFQGDASCSLFLISLKAGGHGLNLTAASYVFLLDPWWNPAVEAQAIDRVYRMGQERKVHAYRLICADTVEEKVAELQARKRELADAVLGDDTSLLAGLSAKDLAFLLE